MSDTDLKNNRNISLKTSVTDLWFHNKWRPALGWTFVVILIFDFILAPIGWSILQLFIGGDITKVWEPLTLRSNGLFIVSMSAIVGVNSYGRTREKIEGGIREIFISKEPMPAPPAPDKEET